MKTNNKFKEKDDEYYLDNEDYWKHDFNVRFISADEETDTEVWAVTSSYTSHKFEVYCSSMEEAFKVAHIAQEMIDDQLLSTRDTSIIDKSVSTIVTSNWKYKSHIDRDSKKLVNEPYKAKDWRNILFDAKIQDYLDSRHQTKLQLMHENGTYTDITHI